MSVFKQWCVFFLFTFSSSSFLLGNSPFVIRKGMKKKEICSHVSCGGEERMVVGLGEMKPSCKIISSSGVAFYLVFHDDLALSGIICSDPRFQMNGLGVGSSYSDILKAFPASEVISKPGYGRMVKVDDDVVFAFLWKKGSGDNIVLDDEKVSWVELTELVLDN